MTNNNAIRGQRANPDMVQINRRFSEQGGYSLVELLVVVIITLLVAAWAIPSALTSIRMAHLRGAASDYSGLLEQARIYSIRDNRYYSTYILAPAGNDLVAQAYVDMLPKVLTGASGNGGTSVAVGDPTITIESDVVLESVGAAPNISNLQSQPLPATTPVTPTDGSVTPPTFGPRGLPCTPITVSGATVCNSSGGPTAFWIFLENANARSWQAVTITPAGRIQKWYYTGSAWNKL
jgi:prepilin-type N-terminal cleavage/methylation domain-containing protein